MPFIIDVLTLKEWVKNGQDEEMPARMWSQVKNSSLGHIQEGLWDTNHTEEYLP